MSIVPSRIHYLESCVAGWVKQHAGHQRIREINKEGFLQEVDLELGLKHQML